MPFSLPSRTSPPSLACLTQTSTFSFVLSLHAPPPLLASHKPRTLPFMLFLHAPPALALRSPSRAPGFMTTLPPGYVPSPKNPMPRLRRRKYAPTKSPPVVSPFKALFGSRRQSLAGGPPAPSLLPGALGAAFSGGGAKEEGGIKEEGGGGAAGAVMAPGEVQLRHCLNARVRRCVGGARWWACGKCMVRSAPAALSASLLGSTPSSRLCGLPACLAADLTWSSPLLLPCPQVVPV